MSLEFWANISAVWLALLCFIGLLIPVAAAYFAIRGMHAVLGYSRSGFSTAQAYGSKIRERTEAYSKKVAEPVIRVDSEVTKVEEAVRRLTKDATG